MNVNPGIFRAVDIRGEVARDLTPPVAYLIGKSIGVTFQYRGLQSVVVGRDNRNSSEALSSALIDGLVACGCHVRDIGCVATPVVYWAAVQGGGIGGVMVTASHLGPEYNGFKVCVGPRTLVGKQILEIRDRLASIPVAGPRGTLITNAGIGDAYLSDLQGRLSSSSRHLRLVLDAGNGMAGPFAPRLASALAYDVIPLFCELDGTYPNHAPDPQKTENMTRLSEVVVETHAQIGLAYDGDGDRVGVIDENGEHIAADRVAVLIVRDILQRIPGAKIVVDALCSQVLIDEILRHGGYPILWKSGHSFIKEKLQDEKACFGVEVSGHMFFADGYYGFDDGIYASARIASIVDSSEFELSQMMTDVPRLFTTSEYRIRCPDKDKHNVVDSVAAVFRKQYELIDVDGARVQFDHGWGLLRASNTEPMLSMRFEASTEHDLMDYCDLFRRQLRAFPMVEPF